MPADQSSWAQAQATEDSQCRRTLEDQVTSKGQEAGQAVAQDTDAAARLRTAHQDLQVGTTTSQPA